MILEYHEQGPAGLIPNTLDYVVDGEVLTVIFTTYKYGAPDPDTGERPIEIDEEHTDTFDFTGFPDGVLGEVETTIPDLMPIVSGEKVDGVLTLTVVDWSNANV